MKTNKDFSYLSAVLLIVCMSSVFTSCSKDDDNPSLSFTKEIISGKWRITNISNTNGHNTWWPSAGDEMEFKYDGTCTSWFSMEDAYKIEGGRIHTYYGKTNEPMFVYTLLSENGATLSVRMDGTLDDNGTCTLTLQKVN